MEAAKGKDDVMRTVVWYDIKTYRVFFKQQIEDDDLGSSRHHPAADNIITTFFFAPTSPHPLGSSHSPIARESYSIDFDLFFKRT